jgi:hypothetical protein
MGRSQWAVLSMLSIYSIPSHHFRLPLPVYPLSQVLQIAERFYQTLLPPIIARGIAKQLGPFAPWELPQFIATADPSATFSPSSLLSFNLLNRANVAQINPVFGSGLIPITGFRQPIAGIGARQIQFSLDFEF